MDRSQKQGKILMLDHDADVKTDDTRRELLQNRPVATITIDLSETTFNFAPARPGNTTTVSVAESREQQLVRLQDEFERYSGAKLVFSKNELATEGKWNYFDRLPELSAERKIEAAEIALQEIKMYPKEYLKALELKTIGIFDACISFSNDGYHEYDPRYGGYRYFGVFNGKDGLAAAYYSDAQLPLTIHHEIFHAADSTKDGVSNMDRFFDEDNKRFSDAVNGRQTYPSAEISPQDLMALKAISSGRVLKGVVSAYTAKNPNEDQAETARYLMDFLPDALIQIVEQPQLPGSQRILHVINEYENSSTNGPTIERLVDVALGRNSIQPEAFQKALLDVDNPALQAAREIYKTRYELITEDGKFTVRGSESHPNGPNLTLQSDIRGFIEDAKKIAELGDSPDFDPLDQQLKLLHLLAGYYNYVHYTFSVTAATQNIFLEAKEGIIESLADNHSELKQILSEKSLAVMSDNPHMEKVDEAIDFEDDRLEREVELKIRSVQPACVKIGISEFGKSWAASGVNLRADGLIITNAHVAQKLNQKVNVTFPNGRTENGTCTAIDKERDLAIIKLDDIRGTLPVAALSSARPEAGTGVVVIGMPSNSHNWYVSTGIVKEYKPDHPWVSPEGVELGGLAHTAWTYWGHSGSPLFDHEGRVIALHNTWNSVTAMRHGIPIDEIQAFLEENDERIQ